MSRQLPQLISKLYLQLVNAYIKVSLVTAVFTLEYLSKLLKLEYNYANA